MQELFDLAGTYSLPFRYTPAAKNIFLSSEYKQSQYPELSYLYPGFVQILSKLVDCLEKCLIYGHIRRFAN